MIGVGLHKTIGLRDVVFESSQFYEKKFNEYVLGLSDEVHGTLLKGIKTLNEILPDNGKIRVHMVDIDWSLSSIHEHLQALEERIGLSAEHIEILSLNEFKEKEEEKMLTQVDQLTEATDDDSILNELETVRASIHHYFAIQRIDDQLIIQVREEAIAQNIHYILKELDGASILTYYGAWHAQKHQATSINPLTQSILSDEQPWVQRLAESGVTIYTIYIKGIGGNKLIGRNKSVSVYADPDRIQFADGTTLGDILDGAHDYNIVYVDLRLEANTSARLGDGSLLTDFKGQQERFSMVSLCSERSLLSK